MWPMHDENMVHFEWIMVLLGAKFDACMVWEGGNLCVEH